MLFLIVFGIAGAAARCSLRATPSRRACERSTARQGRRRRGAPTSQRWLARVVACAPLAKLSVPAEGWEGSPVRIRFINAGWRKPPRRRCSTPAKTALTLLFARCWSICCCGHGGRQLTFLWLVVARPPAITCRTAAQAPLARRQREIFETFPDALDLMTVCVEAGLAMDAALARVAQEIGLKSPVLAEELQLVTLEMRAGSAKEKALRNLALRTGVEDVDALVKMLIQAERFGTSVGASLRVQSDQLRTGGASGPRKRRPRSPPNCCSP